MSEQASTNMPGSRKRSHDEAEGLTVPEISIEEAAETHLPTPTSHQGTRTSPESGRQPSPAFTIGSSVLSDAKTMATPVLRATPPATGPAIAKKRKLTPEEREIERALRQSEKEEKERKRADEVERKKEERLSRDKEKRRKDEEKEAARRQRELEAAEKQKVKDAERQAKEEAKRRKEEEKKKREQSQLRLGSFFQKPVVIEIPDGTSRTSSRRSSVVSLVGVDGLEKEVPTKLSPQKKPEAKHGFLPFFVPKNVELAPENRFTQDENLSTLAASGLDARMKQDHHFQAKDIMSRFKSKKRKRRQKPQRTLKEIIDRVQGNATSPIDLTGGATSQLSSIPYKILSFREDVRPPYKGTYTRAVSPTSARKLSRCPFTRHLPNTNYDYDSEAEWEPPNEDDEDLESGDDESDIAGEEGEEEMDGFLDDEDDPGRRKQIVGEMTPISSGLCWANTNDEKGPLQEYCIQPLSDEHVFPIDPFSTAYWRKAQQTAKQPAMQPPRLPLSNLNPNRSPSMTPPSVKGEDAQNSDVLCQPSTHVKTQSMAATTTGKPLKLAPDDVLPAFKQAVVGSDLTKAGLVEILKKR
jgi:chromatin assembly factor 1 subunit A